MLGLKSTDLKELLSASSKLLTLILLNSSFITACFKDCGAEIQIWLGNYLLEFNSLLRISIDCFSGKLSVVRSKDNIT